MTLHAWLTTQWGRLRETLQPELFALRRELRQARQERDDAVARIIAFRGVAAQANQQANSLAERLGQRTRELKAARAKVRKERAA
jgi:hypothetical protein